MSLSRTVLHGTVAAVTALAALTFPASATANPGDITTEDQRFMDHPAQQGILNAPGLQIRQGQRLCEEIIDGTRSLDALYELMRKGGYSFDEANAISSAAKVVYCYCSMWREISGAPKTEYCSQFETTYIRNR